MTEVDCLKIIAESSVSLVVIQGMRLMWTVFNDTMQAGK